MQLFVTLLHICLCFGLVLIIIIQPGKSDIASAFGGGAANQQYGARGSGHWMGKATTIVAFMYMVTSITLALFSTERMQAGSSGIEDAIEELEEEEIDPWKYMKKPEDDAPPAQPDIPRTPEEPTEPGEAPTDMGAEAPAGDAPAAPAEGADGTESNTEDEGQRAAE